MIVHVPMNEFACTRSRNVVYGMCFMNPEVAKQRTVLFNQIVLRVSKQVNIVYLVSHLLTGLTFKYCFSKR